MQIQSNTQTGRQIKSENGVEMELNKVLELLGKTKDNFYSLKVKLEYIMDCGPVLSKDTNEVREKSDKSSIPILAAIDIIKREIYALDELIIDATNKIII